MYKDSNQQHQLCLQCDQHPDATQNLINYAQRFAQRFLPKEQA